MDFCFVDKSNNQQAFLELVRAGLWEKEARLSQYKNIDFSDITDMAEEQSIVGLITAGLEKVADFKVKQEILLQFIGNTLQIEQRNKAMNKFVAALVDKMRKAGIYTLLIKGQGIAQCYEKPLWRACGDVDFFLSQENYDLAKKMLIPMATYVEHEDKGIMHLGMTIDDWEVELHGSLKNGLTAKVDKGLDEIRKDIFFCGNVRSWINGQTHIFLPSVNNDVVYVFAHILHHFFHGGIGLRQICDWCRLLWTFREEIDANLLGKRLKSMGIMSEWHAFGALAIKYLGMPVEAIPLYLDDRCWLRKADRILAFILETGNFGHNRDMSYRQEKVAVTRKWKTFWHITGDACRQFIVFPGDSVRVWGRMMSVGLRGLVRK